MPTQKTTATEHRHRGQSLDGDAPSNGAATRPGPSTRTPLPGDLTASGALGEIEQLRAENQELRLLIEQAIAQEETHERHQSEWLTREAELVNRIESLAAGGQGGDPTELFMQLDQREETVRQLTEQVRQLEAQAQSAQESSAAADHEELLRAVRERDELIESLTARVTQLEKQIADVPPPAPTDEELARLADELEKERCQITVLRRELEDEKKQHVDDESEFERQMREMEVQMSRERAEMARQRTELQRLQAEVNSDLDAMQRGDASLKDRLASFQRRQGDAPSGRLGAPAPNAPAAPAPTDRDSGFMKRFFGGGK